MEDGMAEIELDAANADGSQAANVGDQLVLDLDETPTSGYRWAVDDFDEAILALLDDWFVPPEPGLLGAPGHHRFRFAVVGPGAATLNLVCRRSWDLESAVERFATTIEASPGLDSDGPVYESPAR
jgi:inhibitor of cysteine peptidase